MSDDKKGSAYVLGIDMGGTKVLAGVVDRKRRILSRAKASTDSSSMSSLEKCFSEVISAALTEAVLEPSLISAIGIGCPGPLDIRSGSIVNSPNLGMKEIPVRDLLRKVLKAPVVMGNDVNVGTFGEFEMGAGVECRNLVGLFPGTGLGGGVIVDGRLLEGVTGNAGELGHMIIQPDGPLCGCGQRGCAEAFVSRSALAKELAGLAAAGKAPALLELAGTDLRKIKSGVILKAIQAGDKAVEKAVLRSARIMGIVMANCVNIFNPEMIVLGGGLVEKLGKLFVDPAAEAMKDYALPALSRGVKVAQSKLGDDAVLLGAACMALKSL